MHIGPIYYAAMLPHNIYFNFIDILFWHIPHETTKLKLTPIMTTSEGICEVMLNVCYILLFPSAYPIWWANILTLFMLNK